MSKLILSLKRVPVYAVHVHAREVTFKQIQKNKPVAQKEKFSVAPNRISFNKYSFKVQFSKLFVL